MKLRISLCAIALVVLASAMAGQASAQDKQATGKDESTASPEMQEMMKKWMDAATPGRAPQGAGALHREVGHGL